MSKMVLNKEQFHHMPQNVPKYYDALRADNNNKIRNQSNLCLLIKTFSEKNQWKFGSSQIFIASMKRC